MAKNNDIKTTKRKDLIDKMREYKKEMQQVRFRTSPAAHSNTGKHKELRKSIAKVAVALGAMKKAEESKKVGDKDGSRV